MLGADGTPLSYNLFAYCLNNPVNCTDATGHWSWKNAINIGVTVTIVGMVAAFIFVSGGTAAPPLLAAIGSAMTSGTAVAVSKGIAIGGVAVLGGATIMEFAKKSKSSQKERSTDKPSYVTKNDVDPSKTAQQNATDILNEHFGVGNWSKGPKSDFDKIVKWIYRGLSVVAVGIGAMRMEEIK